MNKDDREYKDSNIPYHKLYKNRTDSKYKLKQNHTKLDSFAKKSLGQNFLKDENVLEQIVQSIPSLSSHAIMQGKIRLIEIGIGLGDLTKRLLDYYPDISLLVYEIDRRLIEKAKQTFHNSLATNHLVIEQADALHIRKNDGYLFESEYFLVSNLPYYIATPIILQALRDSKCCGFVVMTQKEVAQKFCAKVRQKEFCALSILTEMYGNVYYLFEVPSCCFVPKPKVDSAVFCFERNEKYKIPNNFESLLKQAFISPRKKLLSNLSSLLLKNNATIQDIFGTLKLLENIRPHEVSTQQYYELAQFMK